MKSREEFPLNLYRISAPARARVLATVPLTPPSAEEVRHITIDLSGLVYRFLEGQSMGILPPGINKRGRPHRLRLYSIASARNGDDGRGNTAALCVKRVLFTEAGSSRVHFGVASNYLCDLKAGDEVAITGPAGKHFLLPDDPSSNLILIATGTGIAPFRAFLRRIYVELPAWTGAVHLYFGVRTQAECLYRAEFDELRDRPGFRLSYAFSREQTTADGRRMYVQHRITEQMDELNKLLTHENTHLYMCGLKGMEAGVLAAFAEHASGASGSAGLIESLRKSGRLRIETY